MQRAQPHVNEWSHGLFGCFNDFGICIMSFLCPCVQFGWNAEATGKNFLLNVVFFMVPVVDLLCAVRTRGDLREIRAIEGTTANDFLVWCLCPLCALAQESQEIKAISQGNGPGMQAMARH